MRKFFTFIVCCVFVFTNCKKDTDPPPIEETNKNDIIGYITVAGRDIRLFSAAGSNATKFTRTVEGSNTIITITGWDSVRTIHLQLVNISLPGTYSFQNANATGYTGTLAFYGEGPQSNPTLFYSTASTNSEIVSLGTFNVSTITDSYIQGSVTAPLGDTGEFSKISFDEVRFKGTFEK